MADFPALPLWTDALELRASLARDGWRTPDTYDGRVWSEITEASAVYLFLLYRQADFTKALVAYVGMSSSLLSRIATHNVLPDLRQPGYWPMRWFKPTPIARLRAAERHYIRMFDPPWNIIGRSRGISLQ